ncbi:MAG TPA: hypothetical protein VD867_03625 [Burkholderiales bacterium]|nr:hypothetical protein [Burkholderiales bacterium]
MRKTLLTAAVVSAFLVTPAAVAQVKDGVVAVAATEAVVKVISVDRKARTATVRGPNGGTVVLNVPPDAQNFDRVKPGALFKVRYLESVALVLSKGGEASAGGMRKVTLAPKGGTPGGTISETHQVTGTVEAVDYKSRAIAVKGPGGKIVALKVADEARNLDEIHVGDTISLVYAQALAMEMVPQESTAAPAAKK